MGGFYYTTKAGDMWDYIAWQVYQDSMMMPVLMEAPENRELMNTYIFSANQKVWCPYIEPDADTQQPDWRDNG